MMYANDFSMHPDSIVDLAGNPGIKISSDMGEVVYHGVWRGLPVCIFGVETWETAPDPSGVGYYPTLEASAELWISDGDHIRYEGGSAEKYSRLTINS